MSSKFKSLVAKGVLVASLFSAKTLFAQTSQPCQYPSLTQQSHQPLSVLNDFPYQKTETGHQVPERYLPGFKRIRTKCHAHLKQMIKQDISDKHLTLKDIKKLGIFNERDSRYFYKLLDPISNVKYMLISVDGYYWRSAKEVADSLRSVVGPEITINHKELRKPDKEIHKAIGYVYLENIGKNADKGKVKSAKKEKNQIKEILEDLKEIYRDADACYLLDEVYNRMIELNNRVEKLEKQMNASQTVTRIGETQLNSSWETKRITEEHAEEQVVMNKPELMKTHQSPLRHPAPILPILIRNPGEEYWFETDITFDKDLSISQEVYKIRLPISCRIGIEGGAEFNGLEHEFYGFLAGLNFSSGRFSLNINTKFKFIDINNDVKIVLGRKKEPVMLIRRIGGELSYYVHLGKDWWMPIDANAEVNPYNIDEYSAWYFTPSVGIVKWIFGISGGPVFKGDKVNGGKLSIAIYPLRW